MTDRLYFRQLLAGRDFAKTDPIARQMVNLVYLIGDRETGEALIVDPAYDPAGLVNFLEADGMRLAGVLATHYHADHVGGSLGGHRIAGVAALLDVVEVPVHVQRAEVPWVERTTGVTRSALHELEPGAILQVGALPITCIHTPGHTPGSQCFLVDGKLIAGDTLFLEGCGRTDLPGSDPMQMYESLTHRLLTVPDDAVLYPGHLYSAESSATMGETRSTNYVLAPRSAEEWLSLFGI